MIRTSNSLYISLSTAKYWKTATWHGALQIKIHATFITEWEKKNITIFIDEICLKTFNLTKMEFKIILEPQKQYIIYFLFGTVILTYYHFGKLCTTIFIKKFIQNLPNIFTFIYAQLV